MTVVDPLLLKMLTAVEARGVRHEWPVEKIRTEIEEGAQRAVKVPVGNVVNAEVPGPAGPIPVRVYHPQDDSRGNVVFFHGGGFIAGSIESVDVICRFICKHAGVTVISVEYRLAPEHPFPAAVEDCHSAAQQICNGVLDGIASDMPFAVAGDSAGGNLAAVVAQMARDRGTIPLAGQLLLYPVTMHGAQRDPDEPAPNSLSSADMTRFWREYLPQAADGSDPLASPLNAHSLVDLPTAYIVVAGYDPLYDQGVAYARRMSEAGVDVSLDVCADVTHAFCKLVGRLPAADAAMSRAAAWLSTLFKQHSKS